jgi:twitching motility protein PilT
MRSTGRVRDAIVDAEQTMRLKDIISEGAFYGMQTFDQSLFDLHNKQLITMDEALMRASNPDEFKLRLQGVRSAADAAREEMERQMADFERFARK